MDVRLFHTPDGGEIEVENGQASTAPAGLQTAVYLSWFGGNARDAGTAATAHLQWWGNLGETRDARRYRSATQHLLQSGLPATPNNLKRIKAAAEGDLAWLLETKVASLVSVRVTMPAPRRVQLEARIVVNGQEYPITIVSGWGIAPAAEVVSVDYEPEA